MIDWNEVFASQGLATFRGLEIADDDQRVNPNGGAIAPGHPPGMSGVRITGTAARELLRTGRRRPPSTMASASVKALRPPWTGFQHVP